MNDSFDELKKIVVSAVKKAFKLPMKVLLVIALIIVIFAGSIYYITIDEGTYRKNDWTSTPYVANEYKNNTSVNADGTITNSMTAQELWDKMIEEGNNVYQYLDEPEELLKLMNAQLVTQFLDTRENPDEPIDWEKINDPNSNETQGIIKLKRAKDDGSVITMTYADPETFQSYIDKYNTSGSSDAKNKALSYFTLEKMVYYANYQQSPITAGTVIQIPNGLGSAHTYMGWQMITSETSTQYKLKEKAGMNFDEEGFGRINGRYVIACTTTYGSVGDYIDFYQEDGTIISCIIGDIKNQNDAGCNKWGHENGQVIVEFVVDKTTWYNTNHANPGTSTCHPEWNKNLIKAVNGGSYFDNPTFGTDVVQENSTDSETDKKEDMKWPTDGTEIIKQFSIGNSSGNEEHRGVDIKVEEGKNVYACESGTVLSVDTSKVGGKVVTINHGNGYVSKYMHNSEIKVTVGQEVTKGDIIALSGSTGECTEPQLHFQLEFNGEAQDPLTFRYNNGMGRGREGIGCNVGSETVQTTYCAKIATWNEVTEIEETILEGTAEPIEKDSNTVYNMTSTTINYEDFVSGYTMPFEYLWSLLVVGQEKNFVLDLADLVYGSEIEITVHDNLTVNTNVDVYTYTDRTRTVTDAKAIVYYKSDSDSTNKWKRSTGNWEDIAEKNYKTTNTVITKTNTLDIALTKANVWIVEYTREYTYEVPEKTVNVTENTLDDISEPEEPSSTNNEDPYKHGDELIQSIISEIKSQAEEGINYEINSEIEYINGKVYDSVINRKEKITNTTETKSYVSSPAVIREKTDIEPENGEENFVTIFLKSENRNAKIYILDVPTWLFEILEKNESTADMVDLTKYLLYKATNRKFGVTTYDFSVYDPDKFMSMNSSFGWYSGIDGVPGQIFDFLLQKGVTPMGGAAVLGNIQEASNFETNIVDGEGGASGICNWNSAERKAKLKKFADSKGVDWTDLDIQMEFMWKELGDSYKSTKDLLMNRSDEDDLEYVTWYFGRYYEEAFSGDKFEESKSNSEQRYEYAKEWYEKWKQCHVAGTIENINVYNSDGTVNNNAISQLQIALEQSFNLVSANSDPTQHIATNFTKYDKSICTKVTGDFIGFSGYSGYSDGKPRPIGYNGLSIYQCTWWANGRASMYLQQNGTKYREYPTAQGDGGEYYSLNKSNGWFQYGSQPRANSLVSYKGGDYGHVAYVEAVDYVNKKYYISHAGSGERWYGIWEMDWNETYGGTLQGFIYLDMPK